jgi:hypothetical protein
MTSFHEYLSIRLESGGFTTEDVLVSFLPLVREVLDAHATGLVAPLAGLNDLYVDGVRIWFEQAKCSKPTSNEQILRRIERATQAAVEGHWHARRARHAPGLFGRVYFVGT